MKKLGVVFFSVCVAALLLLASCKNQKKENLFLGKWDLIMWDNVQTPGTLVFMPDGTVYFSMHYTTEIGKYSISGDTLRIARTGGSRNYLSGEEYWMVKKLDTVFLNIVSSRGNFVTAYKQKKFWKIPDQPVDTAAIEL